MGQHLLLLSQIVSHTTVLVAVSGFELSSNSRSGLYPGLMWATRSVLKILKGEVPDNVFNAEVIPQWRERFGGKPAA